MTYDRERYLLDINPNYVTRETANLHFRQDLELNRIDARFIDKRTGLFIDITALSPVDSVNLSTKCPHVYPKSMLYPLSRSDFEQTPIWVPSDVRSVLIEEYGRGAVDIPTYNKGRFRFNVQTNRWEMAHFPAV